MDSVDKLFARINPKELETMDRKKLVKMAGRLQREFGEAIASVEELCAQLGTLVKEISDEGEVQGEPFAELNSFVAEWVPAMEQHIEKLRTIPTDARRDLCDVQMDAMTTEEVIATILRLKDECEIVYDTIASVEEPLGKDEKKFQQIRNRLIWRCVSKMCGIVKRIVQRGFCRIINAIPN